jgi:hypothetical protein
MTGKHRLDPHLNVLKTPSQFAADGARIIASQAGTQQVAGVVHEINQTILGRTLTFSSSAGGKLVLDVLGRRILRLGDAENVLHQAIIGTDHTHDIAQIVRDFAAPMTEIRVIVAPLVSSDTGLDIGLHVAGLAAQLNVDLSNPPSQEPPSFLAKVLASLDQQFIGWILREVGGADQSLGPDETVSQLREILDDNLDDYAAQLASIEPDIQMPAMLVVGPKISTEYATIFARADGQFLYGILNVASANDLQQAWTKAQS